MRPKTTEAVGDRLYADALRHRAERLAASRAAQAVLDPEATFRPQTCTASRAVLRQAEHAADPWRRFAGLHDLDRQSNSGSTDACEKVSQARVRQRGPLSIWEAQYAEAQQRRAERQLLQQLYEVDERRQHSHKPYVCNASRAIDREARRRSASATCAQPDCPEYGSDQSVHTSGRSRGRSGSAPTKRQALRLRVEAPRNGVPIHDSLFADAKEKRRVQMQREAEHEMEIEALTRSLSAKRLPPKSLHRLCYAHRQKILELDALREYLHAHEDLVTGRPLFHPQVTRGPKAPPSLPRPTQQPCQRPSQGGILKTMESEAAVARELGISVDDQGVTACRTGSDGIADDEAARAAERERAMTKSEVGKKSSIVVPHAEGEGSNLQAHVRGDSRMVTGEALHTCRVKHRRSREVLRQDHVRQVEAAAQLPVAGAFTRFSASAHLVKTFRERRLDELFVQLDSNFEGLVDGQVLVASLSSLPPDIAVALRLCIDTFKDGTFLLSDFKALVIEALRTTPPNGPRVSLLPDRSKRAADSSRQAHSLRKEQSECTFRPRLDANSVRLAKHRRDTARPICDQLLQEQAKYSSRRLTARRKAKSEAERLCPFRPSINARSRLLENAGDGLSDSIPPVDAARRLMSSEELELERHCSFKPRTNQFPGAMARTDTSDPHTEELMSALRCGREASLAQKSSRACKAAGASGDSNSGASGSLTSRLHSTPIDHVSERGAGVYLYARSTAGWRNHETPDHVGWGSYESTIESMRQDEGAASQKNAPLPRTIIVGSGAHVEACGGSSC